MTDICLLSCLVRRSHSRNNILPNKGGSSWYPEYIWSDFLSYHVCNVQQRCICHFRKCWEIYLHRHMPLSLILSIGHHKKLPRHVVIFLEFYLTTQGLPLVYSWSRGLEGGNTASFLFRERTQQHKHEASN